MNTPYPMLWFDTQAEEAARLYVSLFTNSSITSIERYPEGVPGRTAGEVMNVEFTLDGAPMAALNGGPEFGFTPAFSLVVDCEDQTEIDRLWNALIADGGAPSQCGWLTDRFGFSWQVVPEGIGDLIKHPAAMEAMLAMSKIDLGVLRTAAGL
jgi:predicted 3-demethylubiquinone-9 3-methyltransferase (glyoxalase superfamily)